MLILKNIFEPAKRFKIIADNITDASIQKTSLLIRCL